MNTILILAMLLFIPLSTAADGPPQLPQGNITLEAEPLSIPADGASTAIITATVFNPDGFLVGGLDVNFETTLGTITPINRTGMGTGVASATLTAGTQDGTAKVTALLFAPDFYATSSIDVEFTASGATSTPPPPPPAEEHDLSSLDKLDSITILIGADSSDMPAANLITTIPATTQTDAVQGMPDPALIVGGPIANKKAKENNPLAGIDFEVSNEAPTTITLKVGGKSYSTTSADYGNRDYAVIAVKEDGGKVIYFAEGNTRFGTRAAAMMLNEGAAELRGKSISVLEWKDTDKDSQVDLEEVSIKI